MKNERKINDKENNKCNIVERVRDVKCNNVFKLVKMSKKIDFENDNMKQLKLNKSNDLKRI